MEAMTSCFSAGGTPVTNVPPHIQWDGIDVWTANYLTKEAKTGVPDGKLLYD